MLDEHYPGAVAEGLRRRSVEAYTVHELGRRGESDESHLAWALENGWVIATHDQDFLRLTRAYREHAGIAFCPDQKYGTGGLVVRLHHLTQAETLESMRGEVRHI